MKKSIFILFVTFLVLSCKLTEDAPIKKPKLLIIISVDQMKADYLQQFNGQLEGGFAELMDNGKVYTNTHHYHAVTTTAAGHATIATGHYPTNNGITDNTVYNRALGYKHYSIEDTTVRFVSLPECALTKVSAARLLKPTLGDLVKANDKNSKTYSVALKDRASILMGGKKANRAFWFDAESTQMVSTDYYDEVYPQWAKGYAANEVLADRLQNGWTVEADFKPVAETSGDSIPQEKGKFYPWFPHSISTLDSLKVPENKTGNFFWNTPFGDEFVLLFAKKIIEEQALGQDEYTDVLTIGLSAADKIGHHFGPHSHEILDYYNKVDQYLADFVNHLNSTVGKENYILTITADHGVAALPEVLAERGIDALRIGGEQFDKDIKQLQIELREDFGTDSDLILRADYGGIEPLFSTSIDSVLLVDSICAKLKRLSYIEDTYSFYDMADSFCSKKYINHYRNSHSIEYGYFIQYRAKENYLVDMRDHGTTHGTPYRYDTHVPFMLYGGVKKGSSNEEHHTVDIVPTMLDLAGIAVDASFDGKAVK